MKVEVSLETIREASMHESQGHGGSEQYPASYFDDHGYTNRTGFTDKTHIYEYQGSLGCSTCEGRMIDHQQALIDEGKYIIDESRTVVEDAHSNYDASVYDLECVSKFDADSSHISGSRSAYNQAADIIDPEAERQA